MSGLLSAPEVVRTRAADARPRRPALRRRRRGRPRGAVTFAATSLGIAASGWALSRAVPMITALPVEPAELARHLTVTALFAVAVLAQSAVLRASGHGRAAFLLPALVVGTPLLVHALPLLQAPASLGAATPRPFEGLPAIPGQAVAMSVHPAWPAVVALLVAQGRGVLRRSALVVAVGLLTVAVGRAAENADLAAWHGGAPWPHLVASWRVVSNSLQGIETGLLRSALAGMVVCAAVVAASRLAAGTRWSLVVAVALPASGLALLPALAAGQGITIDHVRAAATYPLAALAAAAPVTLLLAFSDVVERDRRNRDDRRRHRAG